MKNYLEKARCRSIVSGSFRKDVEEIKDINSIVELYNIYLPPKSWNSYACVRKMLVNIELYQVFTVPHITNSEGEMLLVYAPVIFREHILKIIQKLAKGRVWIDGEVCTFGDVVNGKEAKIYPFSDAPDFWWDLDNAFYMFFGDNYAKLIIEAQKKMREDSREELEVIDWDELSEYYYLTNNDLSEEALEFLSPKKRILRRQLIKVLNAHKDNLNKND